MRDSVALLLLLLLTVAGCGRAGGSEASMNTRGASSPTISTTTAGDAVVATLSPASTAPTTTTLATTLTSATTTLLQPPSDEVLAAWEDMTRRVERLAEEAQAEVALIEAAIEPLTDDDMARDGWIAACCNEPRDALADLMERIKKELGEAEALLSELASARAPDAARYLRMAREKADYLISPSFLWSELARTGNKDIVESAFPTVINHGILGCLRACIVDLDG